MSRIAIDIVLLLSEEMNQICFDINKRAVKRGETEVQLGKSDYLPHISLLMGAIDEKNKEKIIPLLEKIVPHITLHTKNIAPYTLPLSFTCPQIAFNHVGEHGTVRKIFYAQKLETP